MKRSVLTRRVLSAHRAAFIDCTYFVIGGTHKQFIIELIDGVQFHFVGDLSVNVVSFPLLFYHWFRFFPLPLHGIIMTHLPQYRLKACAGDGTKSGGEKLLPDISMMN